MSGVGCLYSLKIGQAGQSSTVQSRTGTWKIALEGEISFLVLVKHAITDDPVLPVIGYLNIG